MNFLDDKERIRILKELVENRTTLTFKGSLAEIFKLGLMWWHQIGYDDAWLVQIAQANDIEIKGQ